MMQMVPVALLHYHVPPYCYLRTTVPPPLLVHFTHAQWPVDAITLERCVRPSSFTCVRSQPQHSLLSVCEACLLSC